MKALITGGNGFVGRHLAATLSSAGHHVEAMDLAGPSEEEARRLAGAESKGARHECDILDFDRLHALLRAIGPDWVVHLAAWSSVGRSFENPARAFEINAQGTVNLLEAVKGLDLRAKVLVVSSAEVYGAVEGEGLTGEDSPVAPVSPYALGKACAELSSLYYGGVGGVDVIIVRAFNHTGPGQTEVFALPGFAKQIAEAEKGLKEPALHVGNLDVVRDFTDVRDVVRAYRMLLEGTPQGALYNVCSGQGRLLRGLVDHLVSLSGVPMEIVVDRGRWRRAEIPALVGDNRRIVRDLGWRPEIPLKKTLSDLLDYWRGRVAAGLNA